MIKAVGMDKPVLGISWISKQTKSIVDINFIVA